MEATVEQVGLTRWFQKNVSDKLC